MTRQTTFRWAHFSGDNKVRLYKIVGGVRSGEWAALSDEPFSLRRAKQITKQLAADVAAFEQSK